MNNLLGKIREAYDLYTLNEIKSIEEDMLETARNGKGFVYRVYSVDTVREIGPILLYLDDNGIKFTLRRRPIALHVKGWVLTIYVKESVRK